ncbi:conserved hypothetical protein; putative signal peptide [Frankia alni ACN14a]|uniref:CobQ/CobB/MinD/ParA nucleotide binding domain-containing protein n=2 Tax=Frankiaceae TaxID=74712 RepID=Q0RB48_FRAAA|nr:conserved hypothetical protein; putative signal peptide [Frankia alni ACN14a]
MLPIETRTFDPLLDRLPLAPGGSFGQPYPSAPPAQTRAWRAEPLPPGPRAQPPAAPPPAAPAPPTPPLPPTPTPPLPAAPTARYATPVIRGDERLGGPAGSGSLPPAGTGAGAPPGERFDGYRPSTEYPAPPPGSTATEAIALGGPLTGPAALPAPPGRVPSWLRDPTVSPARHRPAPVDPAASVGREGRGPGPDPRRRLPAPEAPHPGETRQHRPPAQPPHPGWAHQGRPADPPGHDLPGLDMPRREIPARDMPGRDAPRPAPRVDSHRRVIRQEALGRGGALPTPPPVDGAPYGAGRAPVGPPQGSTPYPDDGSYRRASRPTDADRQRAQRSTGSGRHRGARTDQPLRTAQPPRTGQAPQINQGPQINQAPQTDQESRTDHTPRTDRESRARPDQEPRPDRGPHRERRHPAQDVGPRRDAEIRPDRGHRQDSAGRQDGGTWSSRGARAGRGSRADYDPYPDDAPSVSAAPYVPYPDGEAPLGQTRRHRADGSDPYPSGEHPSTGTTPGETRRPTVAQPGPRDAGGRAGLLTSALLPPPPQTASRGWRKLVYQVSAGAVNPGPSPDEVRDRRQLARIRTPLLDCHRIAVLSLKGGVGKTTTTVAVGSTLASLRGDRVVAIDANPDRGTLGSKVPRTSAHTVRELLEDAPRLHRYVDVRKYLSQADSRLEVLASANDPELSDTFGADDYRAVDDLLQRHYSILLTDCGTGILHSAMHGVLELADTLVIVSSATADGGSSASATLDWLDAHGYADHVREAVAVISMFPAQGERVDVDALARHFEARTRRVVQVPFDPHLADGGRIVLSDLKRETRTAYREIAGAVAERFGEERGSDLR